MLDRKSTRDIMPVTPATVANIFKMSKLGRFFVLPAPAAEECKGEPLTMQSLPMLMPYCSLKTAGSAEIP